LPQSVTEVERLSLAIEIGGMPVRVRTSDPDFLSLLENRYAGFVSDSEDAEIEFDVDLQPSRFADPDAEVSVTEQQGRWTLRRGDFLAEWEATARRGWIRQTANPYSIDAVLRIVHTLVLAKHGGFLLHSASAIRDGRAFLFAGVSGAGKDNHCQTGATRCDAAHRRNFVCAAAGKRLQCFWDSVYRRIGEAGRKCLRAGSSLVPPRERT